MFFGGRRQTPGNLSNEEIVNQVTRIIAEMHSEGRGELALDVPSGVEIRAAIESRVMERFVKANGPCKKGHLTAAAKVARDYGPFLVSGRLI